MKKIYVFIKFFCLGMLIGFLNTNSVNAITNRVISSTPCNGTYGLTRETSYVNPNDGCTEGMPDTIINGMAECAIDNAKSKGLPDRQMFYTEDEEGYVHVIIYDAGRIDVWGNTSGSWEINDALKIKTCQGMDISYITTDEVNTYFDPTGLEDLQLVSIKSSMNPRYDASRPLNDKFGDKDVYSTQNRTFFERWSANKYEITGGTLSGTSFSYNVSVTELGTDYGTNGLGATGLGFNGNIFNKYNNGSRTYNFYIPFRLEFKYKNPNPGNPCLGENGRDYAYDNPGVCCYEYPQTCCRNAEFMDAQFNKEDWRFNACCANIETNGKAMLEGYSYYPFKSYMQPNMYYSADVTNLYNKYCKNQNDFCKWNVSLDDETHCCKSPRFKNTPLCNPENDDNENNPGGDPTKNNSCTDKNYYKKNKAKCCGKPNSEFFKNNKVDCCEATKSMKNDPNWKKTCLTPGDDPNNPDVPIGYIENKNSLSCNSKYTNTKTILNDNSLRADETIKIEQENKQNSIVVDAGTGFNYKLNIIDSVILTRNGSIKTNFKSKSAMNRAIEDLNRAFVNKLNSYKQNIINNSINNNQKISFIAPKININYDNTSIKYIYKNTDPVITTQRITFSYREKDGDKTVIRNHTANIKWSAELSVKYSIDLPIAYISLSSEDIKNRATSGYIDGGRKVYTKTTDPSALYKFYITITNGGFDKKINTTKTNGAYTCAYEVKNCINDGTCVDKDGDDIIPSDGNPDYYFRPISLTNPFPNNRVPGRNWNKKSIITTSKDLKKKYITEKSDIITKTPQYSVTLTSDMIRAIKSYNDKQEKDNKGYLDWNTMNSETANNSEYIRSSKFLNCLNGNGNACNNIGMEQVGSNLKIKQNRNIRNGEFK